MNLFKNAIQAIEDKGIIKIRTYLEDSHVKIQISDNGAGMTQQQMKDAFNPIFTREGRRVKAGLGLFTSFNIIQKHRGQIIVESEINKGKTFTITLPTNLTKS